MTSNITTNYITPITNRTKDDVVYARTHQSDLVNKNKGAWNYTDLNRICNNLKYAAEYMFTQGFLDQPYSMQIKLDWTETDIITYEQLNTMIVDNMNNLYTYSRADLDWYHIASLANIDYNIANWLERNIHALATQEPIPPDKYTLTVEGGTGSGEYEAREEINISANPAPAGQAFSFWSGDHLENIISGSGESANITYRMPNQNIRLQANYTSIVPHTLTISTHSGTTTADYYMGDNIPLVADPAPNAKVFYEWIVEPKKYERNLYEPAATTTFTMPNEVVTLTAFYIKNTKKYLKVNNGTGTGYYDYNRYVSVTPSLPANAVFTHWTGDTQYLTSSADTASNTVKIPDVDNITITANYTYPPTPPVTDVSLTIVNGTISSTGQTTGTFTQYDNVIIKADTAPEGKTFSYWTRDSGNAYIPPGGYYSSQPTVTISTTASTFTANYRDLIYRNLTVTTNSGTTTTVKESQAHFLINANPAPNGYTFDKWTGDTSGIDVTKVSVSTMMGISDRTIIATYRPINPHTVTVKQLSGDVTYTEAEFATITITAENAPSGKAFDGWSLSGLGGLSSYSSQSTIFTFGNSDATLTPNYVNIWTVTVENGTIDGSSSKVLKQGYTYDLYCRDLAGNEGWNGWTKNGPGTIRNASSIYTEFTVGEGDATLTANIIQYPDKTIAIYMRDPDTGTDSFVSTTTHSYGSTVQIIAPIAPEESTFLTWLGSDQDLALLPTGGALASTTTINRLTKDIVLTATYFYPEAPEYYVLTVIKGSPNGNTYATGSEIEVRANTPAQDWEFAQWIGDTAFLVNQDLTNPVNIVKMPQKAVRIEAKYNKVGELPLFRVNVTNGTASATYTVSGEERTVSGVYIDVPEGVTVQLDADDDVVGHVFDYWSGDFVQKGVIDLVTTDPNATFTMVANDLNITMNRRELDKYVIYPTNATGGGEFYVGTYPITGRYPDTENERHTFINWSCHDANDIDCITAITNPLSVDTTVTLSDRDLWVIANYKTHYKLTVSGGQDTGDGYYYEGEIVNSIYANTAPTGTQFDHWEDPVGIIKDGNIYDKTPTIEMKNTIATITAIFISLESSSNSVVTTGNDLHSGTIYRHSSDLISGVFAEGALVLDRDGCIGIITEADPDEDDDTDDFTVRKLFYGGNF